MFYCVNKYQDSYAAHEKKKDGEWRLYFDSEDEAKAFILDRAWRGLRAAEKALKLAHNRLNKCQKKFPINMDAYAKVL